MLALPRRSPGVYPPRTDAGEGPATYLTRLAAWRRTAAAGSVRGASMAFGRGAVGTVEAARAAGWPSAGPMLRLAAEWGRFARG